MGSQAPKIEAERRWDGVAERRRDGVAARLRHAIIAPRVGVVYGLVTLAISLIAARAIFFHYYNLFFNGGDNYDLNLFAFLIWRNEGFRHFSDLGASFFEIHVAPLLLLTNWLSYLYPGSQETFFSGFMGLIHGSFVPAFMAAWWVVAGGGPADRNAGWRDGGLALLGGLLALAFALNGIVLKGLWLGHYEFIIPILIIALILALATGRAWLIGASLVLLLLQREDAGFHAFSFLFLLIAYWHLVEKRPLALLRREIIVAGTCFATSFLLIGIVMPLTDSHSVAESIWAGHPPWAHLTWSRIGEVLSLHRERNAQLYLPALVLIGAALWRRRPAYLIGLLAPLPWVAVHLIAAHTGSAYVYAYKAFPFVVTLVWPLIIEADALLRARRRDDATAPIPPVAAMAGIQGLLLAASLLPIALDWPGMHGVRLANIAGPHYCAVERTNYYALANALPAIQKSYPRMMVGPSIRRLAPDRFGPDDTMVWYGSNLGEMVAYRKPRLMVFMGGGAGYRDLLSQARANGLTHLHRIPETAIMVAATRPLLDLGKDGPPIQLTRPVFHPLSCPVDVANRQK